MKLRVIGLMAFLFAGNAAAEEVHLLCQGTYTSCKTVNNNEDCSSKGWGREFKIDEEAGTVSSAKLDSDDWEEAESVEFTPSEVRGEFKQSGNLWTRYRDSKRSIVDFAKSGRDFSIDRRTGRVAWNSLDGDCRVVEEKTLF